MKPKSFLLFLLLSICLLTPKITLAAYSPSFLTTLYCSTIGYIFNDSKCKPDVVPETTTVYVPTYITPPSAPPTPPQTTIIRTSPPSVTNTYPTYYAPPYPPAPPLPSTGYITPSQLQTQITALHDFIRRQAEQTGSDSINNFNNNTTTFDPSTLTTSSIAEGTNLYYTDARVASFMAASSTFASSTNYWTKTGTNLTYTGGNVGIGTASPTRKLHVESSNSTQAGPFDNIESSFTVTNNTASDPDSEWHGIQSHLNLNGSQNILRGGGTSEDVHSSIRGYANYTGTAFLGSLAGVIGRVDNESTGTIENVFQFMGGLATNIGHGTITNFYGMYLPRSFYNNGTVTNTYGVYVSNLHANPGGPYPGGTQTNTPYSFYASDPFSYSYFAGNTGIGTTTPRFTLQVASSSASNTMIGQLALTDSGAGTNLKHWLLTSMRGNLYIGTTTDAYATSTPAALTILNNGSVGIGTANPTNPLNIKYSSSGVSGESPIFFESTITPTASYAGESYGGRNSFALAGSQNFTASITNPNTGFRFYTDNINSGTVTALSALSSRLDNEGGGTITNAIGFQVSRLVNTASTITNLSGVRVGNLTNGSGGVITNTYGVYVDDLSIGTQTNMPYSFYASDVNTWNYFAGNTGMGTTSPYAKLSVASTVIGSTTMALRPIASQTANILDIYSTAGVLNTVINSNGNVGLGTTTPSSKLSITQAANTPANGIWVAGTDGDFRAMYMSDTAGTMSFFGGNTAGTLNTATLSDVGAWVSASDISYKDNVTDLKNKYNLDTLLKLQPRFYTMKGTGKPQIGFIAQEVKSVIPEVVEGQDGSMGISYGNLVAMAVQGVKDMYGILQSLIQKVDGLANEVTTKKANVEILCVGQTCLSEEQIKYILGRTNVAPTPPSPNNSSTTPDLPAISPPAADSITPPAPPDEISPATETPLTDSEPSLPPLSPKENTDPISP